MDASKFVMPTPFESAQLILTLYEQRRDETLRKARDFYIGFSPTSFDDWMATLTGPHSGYLRMVLTYWDMAASLVKNGAIDHKMFIEANGEFVIVFGKVEPYLPQLREALANPGYLASLEWLALGIPDARNRIDSTVKRVQAMVAARAARAN